MGGATGGVGAVIVGGGVSQYRRGNGISHVKRVYKLVRLAETVTMIK